MPETNTFTLVLTEAERKALRHAVAYWASSRHEWRMERLHMGDAWATQPTEMEIAAERLAEIVWDVTDTEELDVPNV